MFHDSTILNNFPNYFITFIKLSVGVIGIEPIQTKSPDLQSGPALQLRRTPLFLIKVKTLKKTEPIEGFEPPTR